MTRSGHVALGLPSLFCEFGLARAKDTSQPCWSSFGANGSQAMPRLHMLASIDKKVIEVLNANQAKPQIFHVGNSIECDRQGSGENQHMDPAARPGRSHAKAGKKRAA